MALKTLTDCKPSEFLAQTVKIKRAVANWLSLTDILNIRKNQPSDIIPVPPDGTEEEKAKVAKMNREAFQKQAQQNISEMFDACAEEHPTETLEVLALCCFVDPEHVDDYPVTDYIEAFTKLIQDKTVLDFFISLGQLGKMNTSVLYRA
jgi:hypothetical protein